MPPRKATLYTLITRPRISLAVMSCTSELIIEKTPIIAAPEKNSSAQLSTSDLGKREARHAAAQQQQHQQRDQSLLLDIAKGGHDQRARHRTRARARKQNGEGRRPAVEYVFGEDRQEGEHRDGQRRHQKRQRDQSHHGALLANEADALLHAGKNGFARLARHELDSQQEQRNDDRDE